MRKVNFDQMKSVRLSLKQMKILKKIASEHDLDGLCGAIHYLVDQYEEHPAMIDLGLDSVEPITTETATPCCVPEEVSKPVESSISGISKNPVKLDITGMTSIDVIRFSPVAVYRIEDELSRCLGFERESVDTLKKWKSDYELLLDSKGADTSQIDRAIYSQYPILVDKVASNYRIKIRPLMYMMNSYLGELKKINFFKEELISQAPQYQAKYKYEFDSAENGVTGFYRSREYITDHFRSCPPPNKELIELLMADRDFFYTNLRNEKN